MLMWHSGNYIYVWSSRRINGIVLQYLYFEKARFKFLPEKSSSIMVFRFKSHYRFHLKQSSCYQLEILYTYYYMADTLVRICLMHCSTIVLIQRKLFAGTQSLPLSFIMRFSSFLPQQKGKPNFVLELRHIYVPHIQDNSRKISRRC